jgi:hypothetical protein
MSDRGLHLVPELHPNSESRVLVEGELHFYTGKDELGN